MAEHDKLTEAIRRKRSEFSRVEPGYQFFEESYKGGIDYVSSRNLHKHAFEDEDSFDERKARAFFYNYSAPIVNAYNSFIYRQEIKRDYGVLKDDVLFQKFLTNADRQGNSYEEVVRKSSKWSSVKGIEYWIIDKPSNTANNKKQELDQALFPYLVRVDASNVWDWGLDEFGNLLWVKIRETVSDQEDFKKQGKAIEQFRVWYRDRWELYIIDMEGKERKARLDSEGLHPIGEVPLVCVCHSSEEPMLGMSLLNDIAYVNRALFNWCSLLDEILYRQTFSQFIFPEDPENPQGDKALGTAKGLGFPPEATHPPSFISPDSSQATVLITQIEKGVEEIYRLATLRGAIGVTEQSSGVARAYDFMITNTNLANKAINMEEAEMKAIDFWYRWQNPDSKKEPEHMIEYPRDFDIKSLEDEIANALEAQTLKISNRFMELLKERIVKKMLPRLARKDMDLILEELEANTNTVETTTATDITKEVDDIIKQSTDFNSPEEEETSTS